MLQELNIQEAYTNLFNRQKTIPEIKYSCSGIAAYIGELAPSSNHYINNDKFIKHITLDGALGLPQACPMSCDYCPNYKTHKEHHNNITIKGVLSDDHKEYLKYDALANYDDNNTPLILFGGPTDPLLYPDTIIDIMDFYNEEVLPNIPQDIWFHSYTTALFITEDNIRALVGAGLKELIIHIGASGFSEQAYNNIRMAKKYVDTITIETPSWGKHRENIFNMLPILEDIGIDHLNMTSIDINNNNKHRILEGSYYKVFNNVLDDDGIVYDIMREVIDKKYSYSVFDLNNFVVMHSQGEARECLI
jgi:pyruvate formate-lyase activating enzyme-like uncharacterized protein